MPQDFDLRINGKSILVKQARLMTTFDTPGDGFTAQIIVNRKNEPDLWEAVQPFAAPLVEIYIENELKLTGTITNPRPLKSLRETIRDLEGFSATYNFVDSDLAPPYEFNNLTLQDIAEDVAGQTATPVIFADAPTLKRTSAAAPEPDIIDSIFYRATVSSGQSAFEFLQPLADERNRVISCTPQGEVIFQQADTSTEPVGILEEDKNTFMQNYGASFDLRERFKTFKVIMNSPFGRFSGVATDDNINQPRHKIMRIDEQEVGGMLTTAQWLLNKMAKKSLTHKIEVIGWRAPDKNLWSAGTLVTIKSETMGIENGFTFFINGVEYVQSKNDKKAVLDLIPPQVYSNQPIVEPWFN